MNYQRLNVDLAVLEVLESNKKKVLFITVPGESDSYHFFSISYKDNNMKTRKETSIEIGIDFILMIVFCVLTLKTDTLIVKALCMALTLYFTADCSSSLTIHKRKQERKEYDL